MLSGANRPYVPEISRETIIDPVAHMNRVGFSVLSGYLETADLEDLRQFVETAVAAAGGEYVVFTGEEAVAGTLLDKLSASPAFVNLLHRIYEQGSGRAAPNQSLYQVLRCLKGKSGLKHALRFDYDSYVVTALLLVIIQSQGSAGHLVMAPNRRPADNGPSGYQTQEIPPYSDRPLPGLNERTPSVRALPTGSTVAA